MQRTRKIRYPKLVHDGNYVKAGMLEDGRLFDHQKDALAALAEWFKIGSDTVNQIAMVVMPTGTGKTGVICCLPYYFGAAVSNGEMKLDLSKPILIIAPNLAILKQLKTEAFDEEENFLLERGIITRKDCVGPGEDLRYNTKTVENAQELKELKLRGDIILSNVQQWHERGSEEPPWKTIPNDHFSVVIIDEAHHLPAKQWQSIVDKFCSHAKVCFFTATPERSDGKPIISDESHNGRYVYELKRDTAVSRRIIRDINPTYIPNGQEDQGNREENAFRVLREVVSRLADKNTRIPLPDGKRHQAMILARNISHAKCLVQKATSNPDNQVHVELIHSNLPKAERKAKIKKLKDGKIDIIVAVKMLLEGFDHPPISIAGIATHIVSKVKFQQFIGRAQRVVRSKSGDLEDEQIKTDMITHENFEQKELFDNFIRPTIPEDLEPEEPEEDDDTETNPLL